MNKKEREEAKKLVQKHIGLINQIDNAPSCSLLDDIYYRVLPDGRRVLTSNSGYLYSASVLARIISEMKLLNKLIDEYMPFAVQFDTEEFTEARRAKVDLDSEEWYIRHLAEKKMGKKTFIYLMHNVRNGFYRISHANDVDYQEEQQITTVHTISGNASLEREFRQFFSDKRIKGEWFALDEEEVAFIKSL